MFLLTRTSCLGTELAHTSYLGVFDTQEGAENYMRACIALHRSGMYTYAVHPIAHNLLASV